MSVLRLRRDMIEDDREAVEPARRRETVVEIETPLPLRSQTPKTIDVEATPVIERAPRYRVQHEKTVLEKTRGWVIGLGFLAVVAVYPVMIVAGSDVGDRTMIAVDRGQWTAPWVGAAAGLTERQFDQMGWASDAPSWAPMARLTAKPAFQTALAESVGDYVNLMHRQAIGKGVDDADLLAASRLASVNSTGSQMRATRDALISYDRRLRRRGATPTSTPEQIAGQLGLIESWATRSQTELKMTPEGGLPFDASATVAVYKAKGRAMAAYAFVDTMLWPEDPRAVSARNAALSAWKAAAEFHPLVVLNGSPDAWLFGNHPTSMGFLVGQAQQATAAYRAALVAPAPVPVAEAAPPPATLVASPPQPVLAK